jgi:hypothetical protein
MKLFLKAAMTLLIITASAKLLMVLGEARILGSADPLISFLSNRQVLFLVGALELWVAYMIYRSPGALLSLSLVAWLSTLFLLYRVGLWGTGFQGTCGCLGNLAEMLGVKPATLDLVVKTMLAYLLVGSYFFLGRSLYLERKQPLPQVT